MAAVKVFLSYRRADTQHVAGRVADRLVEKFELFMDIDTIPPGVDFTDYVRQAVSRCDVLVAFIGDRWLSLTDEGGRRRIDDPADWVAEEIKVALGRGVRVIPVLVDGAQMPTTDALPEALRPLVNRQALPLRHATFSADLTRLVAGIEHAAVPTGGAAVPAPGPVPVDGYAGRWDSTPGRASDASLSTVPHVIPATRPGRSRRRPAALALALVLVAALAGVLWAVLRSPDTPATGAAGAAPPVTQTEGPGAGPTPAGAAPRTLQQLRSHIPDGLRQTCRALQPKTDALKASLLVAAQCVPAQGDLGGAKPAYAFYFAYTDPQAAERAFRRYYAADPAPEGNCTGGPGEHPWQVEGLSGTVRCYTDNDGYQVFAWTASELSMVASAADPAMTFAELDRWWRLAGPVA